MKKLILGLALVSFSFITLLTSCNTPATKLEEAKEDVAESKENLKDAKEEYLEDLEAYRAEENQRIAANNETIAQIKLQIEKEKAVEKSKHQKQIAELEAKNTEMKMKIDAYQADGKENWEHFKLEFKRDMDKLGSALKDLTVKNVK
jgi:pyruvate/2-oxoacid:ferredoxin oxidoreductase beta subunit